MSNTATENKSNNNNSSNSDSDAATHMRIKTLKTLGRHALVSSGEVNFGCDDVVSMVEGSGNDVSSVGFQVNIPQNIACLFFFSLFFYLGSCLGEWLLLL